MFLFLIPFCRSLLLDSSKDNKTEKKVCVMVGLIPIAIQFMIEAVQMFHIGLDYFVGWNLTDLMFIISYVYYAHCYLSYSKI